MRANSLFALSASVITAGVLGVSVQASSHTQVSASLQPAQGDQSSRLALASTMRMNLADPPWYCIGGDNSGNCPQKQNKSNVQAPDPAPPDEPPAPAETVPAWPG